MTVEKMNIYADSPGIASQVKKRHIELTINRTYKQIITDKCITAGLIDLVAATNEANMAEDDFVVCYAILTAEVRNG